MIGTAIIGTADNRPAAAQNLKADPKAGLSAVVRPDLSTDLNIGLRIELSMGFVAGVRATEHEHGQLHRYARVNRE
jgi:hypothetical protein